MRHFTNLFVLFLLFSLLYIPRLQGQPLPELNATQVKNQLVEIRRIQNPQESIKPLQQLLRQTSLSSDSLRSVILLELGTNFGRFYSNDSAIHYLTSALTLTKAKPWVVLTSEIYNYAGNVMRNRSDNQKAMHYYDSALQALGDNRSRERYVCEAKILGNIGGIHYDLEEFEKALEFAGRSSRITEEHQLNERKVGSYIMLAFAARASGKIELATVNTEKALVAMNELKDSSYLAHTYYNLASLQQIQKKWDAAYQNFGQAYAVAIIMGEEEVAVSCLISQGQINLQKQEFDKAYQLAEQALQRSLSNRFFPKILEGLDIQYQSLKAKNLWKEAAIVQEKRLAFKDSLFNVQSKQQVSELETRYETQKKEETIRDLEQQRQIRELEATTARQWRLGLLIIVVLLLFVMAVLYNRYQLKQRAAKVMDEKNLELRQLNSFKDRMFAVISHDLRNPVDAFSMLMESLNQNLQHASQQEMKEFMESMLTSARDLKGLLNNLLEWSMVQIGKLPFNPKPFIIDQAIRESISHIKSMADAAGITISYTSVNTVVTADRNMVVIAVRNILTNAIKFSHQNGNVFINVMEHPGKATVTVRDEGLGISADEMSKLFNDNEDARSIGNSSAKGSGIGLLLCKELIARNGGRIYAESTEGKGSIFYIDIPLV